MKWKVVGIGHALMPALVMAMGLAQAAEIKVIASNAVKGSVQDVTSRFEKTSGHKVIMTWGGTEAITKRVSGGDVFDVVIIAAPNIDKLMEEGKIVRGSRTDFAKSGIGVAIRTGLPRPDISTAGSVKQAVLKAHSIAYS
jgi:molybdate transport system substrate-binding protein